MGGAEGMFVSMASLSVGMEVLCVDMVVGGGLVGVMVMW